MSDVLKINLLQIRQRWAFSQAAFGKRLNVTRNIISNWERGRSAPEITDFVLLERLSGYSMNDLFSRELKRSEIPEQPLVEGEPAVVAVGDMVEIRARLEVIEGLLRELLSK